MKKLFKIMVIAVFTAHINFIHASFLAKRLIANQQNQRMLCVRSISSRAKNPKLRINKASKAMALQKNGTETPVPAGTSCSLDTNNRTEMNEIRNESALRGIAGGAKGTVCGALGGAMVGTFAGMVCTVPMAGALVGAAWGGWNEGFDEAYKKGGERGWLAWGSVASLGTLASGYALYKGFVIKVNNKPVKSSLEKTLD